MAVGGYLWKFNYGEKFSSFLSSELVVSLTILLNIVKSAYSPIELVTGRAKTISVYLKARAKNIHLDDIEEKIDDIAGIRIICQFVEDIYKVVDIIRQRSDMQIKNETDYIQNMKESGYRSYHMTVYYNVETLKGTRKLQVEIQISTLAMNLGYY